MTEPNGLAAALAALQTQLPKIRKTEKANTGTYTYTYADLAGISEQLLPIMGKLGLSFTSRPTLIDGRFVLAYRLWHASGESLDGEYPLPSGNPQQIGSAITYGRRYSLCAVTGVAPEDDDGAAASTPQPQQQQQRADNQPGPSRRGKPAGENLTIGKRQLAALHIKLGAYGIGGEANRDVALAYMAETIGHDLESSKLLTEGEFRKVMNRLDTEMQPKDDPQQTPPEPGGDDDPWDES